MSGAYPDGTIRDRLQSGSTRVVTYVGPLLTVLLGWAVIAHFELIDERTLPPPTAVWESFVSLTSEGTLTEAIAVTLPRAGAAFAIGVSAGVLVGLTMSQFRLVEWFFDPILSTLFPIPKITLVPVFILWLGPNTTAVVTLAAFEAFFPVAIATHGGTKSVDRELIWSARAMGLSRLQTAVKVVLPASLPDVLNGAQISLFLTFAVIVVSEMVLAPSGLGQILTESMRSFQTADAIAVIVVVALFGLLFDGVFRMLQARFTWWAQ
ncbi:ABC transporter permease [Halovivax cerinus]|uniref:ABC transporter permease n=1 Tax=Halovivax cerinus TaxID=1487865 RepID=A0ABD5NP56_9EURY|nr:ABC transporter permease [Halovivax cerinus]